MTPTGIVDHRIDVGAVTASVRGPEHGAILTFEGVARNVFGGKAVLALEYEAWAEAAERELTAICTEAAAQWGVRATIVHRTGRVEIEEPSVVIAVGAAHRDAAYQGSRFCLEQLKARVTIWKREIYADGSAWIANADGAAPKLRGDL